MKNKILDLLYLPVFISRYKKHYKNINECVKDYFMYYAIEKVEI